MKFKVCKTSDFYKDEEREINSLEDLKKLQEEFEGKPHDEYLFDDPCLVVDFKAMTIEIYDYYRE